MSAALPLWLEIGIALLLVGSGLLSLIAAIGLVTLKDFFQRMHPPALASTLGTWCVALASIVFFYAAESRIALHAWLIMILLSITAPITTALLARAARQRQRAAGLTPAQPSGKRSGDGGS